MRTLTSEAKLFLAEILWTVSSTTTPATCLLTRLVQVIKEYFKDCVTRFFVFGFIKISVSPPINTLNQVIPKAYAFPDLGCGKSSALLRETHRRIVFEFEYIVEFEATIYLKLGMKQKDRAGSVGKT